ncbi:actin-binding protein IPP-like [Acropora muricata]|uniref:actin-binding protein IPP-like n=1 Tax=Acropora muricata TaxID=159855 RepID=UPI0034E54584
MALSAEISESIPTIESDEEIDDEAGSEKQEKESVEAAKHPFCEPWQDSDLIFVVEEERFHVHRQIMSIHSPVFRAMLNSVGFKEATATEIPLPGKKANEFLDFLELLYMKKINEVQLNQVEHLLKLADEYQASGIVDVCVKIMNSEAQCKDNVVKILHLATCTPTVREDERLILVREQCYEVTKNMELTETQGKESYENLEKDAMERVLVERIQRLEKFVKEIYPQFMGLVEWCLWHVVENAEVISTCPQHFLNKKPRENLLRLMKGCSVCRQMIKQLIFYLRTSQQTQQTQQTQKTTLFANRSSGTQLGARLPAGFFSVPATTESKYGGNRLLDEKVITIIQDFEKIIRYCETL